MDIAAVNYTRMTFIDICLFIDIAAYRCLLTDILYRQGQCVFIVSLS